MAGSVRSAAGLVWRHQRLVWWIFFVNLLLAWLASLPVRATLAGVIGHSLASARMVNGFDVGTFAILAEQPEVQPRVLGSAVAVSVVVMFFYLLFIDGGLFAVYLDDRKLSRSEFFENSGLYLWRMFRLAIYSLVPFALLAAMQNGISSYSDKLSRDASPDRLGFYAQVAGGVVVLLLALGVRLWFDLTQARVVRENERRLLRTLGGSFRMLFRSGLYWEYTGIGIAGGVAFAAGAALWYYLPHRALGASFVVVELMLLVSIATRLWMKAASARWVSLLPVESVVAPTMLVEVPTQRPVITEAREPGPLHTTADDEHAGTAWEPESEE